MIEPDLFSQETDTRKLCAICEHICEDMHPRGKYHCGLTKKPVNPNDEGCNNPDNHGISRFQEVRI